MQPSLFFVCLFYKGILFLTRCQASYLQRCTFYNRRQNQSGTARPWSNLSQGVPAASATCAQRDHPAGSHRSWGKKKKKKRVNQSQLHLMICTHTPLKLNPFADERERQGLRTQRTECIDWAPVCCSVTSDSDGKLLELAEPWCCPCWSHQRSGCPGRHAPCLACGGRKKLYWRGGAQNQRTFRPEKYSQPTLLVPIQLEKDWK